MPGVLQARRALVLYGSETGNAQEVAEEMGRVAERLHFDTKLAELNAASLKQLIQHEVVLISISTTGQGELPANSRTFWRALRNARLRSGCLQQMTFASFGLGDTSYPKFNWAHRKLFNRLVQLGARSICDRGESDEQHPEGIDGTFLPWLTVLRDYLLKEYPLPEGLEPISEDVLLEPKWTLAFADQEFKKFLKADFSPDSGVPSDPYTHGDVSTSPLPDLLDVPQGLTARIVRIERLTPTNHWQNVRHLEFNISGQHHYIPGDVLTIYPKNFASDVNHFILLMGWESLADIPLQIAFPQSSNTSPILTLPQNGMITLRNLLTNHLDILSIPRRPFFAHIAHFTNDSFHHDRLIELANPVYIDELYDYTTRPRRSILEVLQEFDSVKIPWQRICSVIPVMRGRQFSIASAVNTDMQGSDITKIELLVAIVKYKTIIRRIRQGVATRYINSLKEGQDITVTLSKGGLGVSIQELEKPVVMVGPGTGIAPMRALIYQRLQWRRELGLLHTSCLAKDILFFGCRNASADYFFEHEWKKLQTVDTVPLEVFVAFSRDQQGKRYVQHLLAENSAQVYDALATHKGIMYICGSSGKMPSAVREALIEVFEKHGEVERSEADRMVGEMEKEGRLRQETW